MKGTIAPVNTWFFRDGTPFGMEDSLQAGVSSLFPPPPNAVAAALRAALARVGGWDGRGRWGATLPLVLERLGNGPTDLGSFTLRGPIALLKRDLKQDLVVPAPEHVVLKMDGKAAAACDLLTLPHSGVICDLGQVLIPTPADGTKIEKRAPTQGLWLRWDGLKEVVRSKLPQPEHFVRAEELFVLEDRTGIARDRVSRTAREGALYSTRHVRLRDDVRFAFEVTGVEESWEGPLSQPFPLGGESRMASCEPWNGDFALPSLHSGNMQSFALIALTPLLLSKDAFLGRSAFALHGPPTVEVRVISAASGRPLRIGGWDGATRSSLPLRNALAPGSVLYCKPCQSGEDLGRLPNPVTAGDRREAGFGLCALACIPEPPEKS